LAENIRVLRTTLPENGTRLFEDSPITSTGNPAQ
jgi:hypothetical protein